jgi:hypothetical protein
MVHGQRIGIDDLVTMVDQVQGHPFLFPGKTDNMVEPADGQEGRSADHGGAGDEPDQGGVPGGRPRKG